MREKLRIISIILIICISSCDQEDPEPFNHHETGLISQVLFDSVLFYEYSYNDANQIVEEKSKLQYTKHNYQAGRLISSDYYLDPGMYSSTYSIAESAMNRKEWVNPANTEKNSSKTYFYDTNGKLLRSSNDLVICTFNYDENGRIIHQSYYRDEEETGYIDFIYDENDNLLKRLHYWILDSGEAELQTTTEYEFDNKPNPFKAFNSLRLPGLYTNTNNITKEIYKIYFEVDQMIENVQVTENVYQYNAQGYPVSKNETVEYKYY